VSTQVRTLAEMALVRICRLQDLDDVAGLIEQLKSGDVGAPGGAKPQAMPRAVAPAAAPSTMPPAKKNAIADPQVEPAPVQPRALPGGSPPAAQSSAIENGLRGDPPAEPGAEAPPAADPITIALDEQSAEPIWKRTLDRLTGSLVDSAAAANISVDGAGKLVASFPNEFFRNECQRNLARIQAALAEICGRQVGLVLTTHKDPAGVSPSARPTLKQQQADLATQPFVKRAMELFDVEPGRMRVTPSEKS
jgi:DNA polymerase-3 subunit gamma/tau